MSPRSSAISDVVKVATVSDDDILFKSEDRLEVLQDILFSETGGRQGAVQLWNLSVLILKDLLEAGPDS